MVSFTFSPRYGISRLRKELGRVSIFNQSIIWHQHTKDHVKMDHLTDLMLLSWTEIKLWTFRHGSKSRQMSIISWQRPPKLSKIYTLKNSLQFCDNCKIRSFTDYVEITERKITLSGHSYEYHRNCQKKTWVYMTLGDVVKKLSTFVWILSYV